MKKMLLITLNLMLASILYAQETTTYVLCEGNFGTANSSLWSFNSSGGSNLPIHWDENSNPLGDVGQSLTIFNDKLFIVMNNSHTIEVMDLTEGAQYLTTINLPNASPRYLYAENSIGYVTSWGLNAIIVLNLNNMETIDTIQVNGMPEYIINYQNHLYVSIPSNTDWSTNDQVIKIDKDNYNIVTSFTVEPGPSMMVLKDSLLYISSSSYDDSWNTYAGTSKINLQSNEVSRYNAGQTSNYGSDIFSFQNNIYRLFDGGVVPIDEDLSPDSSEIIGDFGSIYSAYAHGDYIYFGKSDYIAPDTVLVVNSNSELISNYIVGAIPGSFAFTNDSQVSVIDGQIVNEYSLIRNYPNPFNPKTTIQYDIRDSSPYRLYISNINGKIVKEFQITDYSVGSKSFIWNANSFSSGIYFAVMEQGHKTRITKLSLIK